MDGRYRNHAKDLDRDSPVPCWLVDASGEEYMQEDRVVREHFLEVLVNGQTAFRLSCTPDRLTELVVGRLCTEGLIRSQAEIEGIFICGEGSIAEVTLAGKKEFLPYRGSEPTCCTGNRQYLQAPEDREKPERLREVSLDPAEVFRLAERFKEDSDLHRTTRGTHSCYIRPGDGTIIGFEDIGRHNAIDKAVGYLLLTGGKPEECMLYTTGRIAADMVTKVIRAGIPVLISKAVPTGEAIRLAKEYGLTLIGKAWPDSYRIYMGAGLRTENMTEIKDKTKDKGEGQKVSDCKE